LNTLIFFYFLFHITFGLSFPTEGASHQVASTGVVVPRSAAGVDIRVVALVGSRNTYPAQWLAYLGARRIYIT
jgi:hypothetical protein